MVKDKKRIIGALDIGTSKVIALIGEIQDNGEIQIIGMSQVPSRGLRAGMVTNIDATTQAIKQAVDEASMMAGCTVNKVITGIAGNHIRSMNSQGVVRIKDGEVTEDDIDRAIETAKTVSIPPEHEILHTVVQEYIIDNHPGVRDPIGMSGIRLDTRVHIITGSRPALQNIEKCILRCGLEMSKVVLQPLASGQAVLSDDEKELGVCVIDIGGGTTDIAVYTNGAIRHTAVIGMAGDLITNDLSIALRTPSSAAEQIKTNYGAVYPTVPGLDEMVEVLGVGDRPSRQISREGLARVIEPRVTEIFEFVQYELRRSGFSEDVLTSGIVLTGGTAMLEGIVELAEDFFGLPARVGVPTEMLGVSGNIRNPRNATVVGLLYAALHDDRNGNTDLGLPMYEVHHKAKEGFWKRLKNWCLGNY